MQKKNEQIEYLISFVNKYQKIIIQSTNSHSPEIDEYSRLYNNFNEEHAIAKKCYDYLRVRKSQGKLTEDELDMLQKGNVGGVFGYSNEVGKSANNYNFSIATSAEIIRKYGSIDNFFNEYKNNNLKETDAYIASTLLKSIYDIDLNKKSNNYDKLAISILNLPSMLTDERLYYYSSKKLEEAINNSLNDNMKSVIEERFGLRDGRTKTLEQVAAIFNVTREKIRQLEAISMTKLRKPTLLESFSGNLNDIIEKNNDLNSKKMIYEADTILRLSRELDEKTMKAKEIINNVVNSELNKKESSNEKNIRDIILEEIDLSIRTFNILKRGNLRTLDDIINLDYDQLSKIRDMGRKSIEEIISIMNKYGYEMIDGKFIAKDEIKGDKMKMKEEIDIKDKKIEDISMSKRLYNCLNRSSQIKTFGDILSHNVMYYVKLRNLGKGSLKELLDLVHSYGYTLVGEDILDENNSEKSTFSSTTTADIKENTLIEKIANQNEEQRKRLEEKKEKSKLLDEYISLMLEQQKLNKMESELDEEIKQKEEQLKKLKLKNENK